MKRKIVISINPQYVEKIISGEKRFEYRTKAAKNDINKIIIYETKPIKKIVAEVEILDVVVASPDELWNETKEYSGISRLFFDDYFKGRKVAYAYKLGYVKVYEQPKSLLDFGLKTAPQSFAYVE